MATGKFYAYRNGVEVKDHPLNGATWAGNGGYVGWVGNYPVIDGVCVMRGRDNVRVRAAECQTAPVMLKEWWPADAIRYSARKKTTWYVFGTADQIAAAGKTMRPGFDAGPEAPANPAGPPPESADWSPEDWEYWHEVGQHVAAEKAVDMSGENFNREWAGYTNEYARLEAEAEAAAYRAEMDAEAGRVPDN